MVTDNKKEPRYIQLSNHIRRQIQSGEWEEGDRLPSFVDMYREYGATPSTMQRVYDVLQKEGFIERRSSSGIYVTNPSSVQTGIIAFVVPDEGDIANYPSSPYSTRLLYAAHHELAMQGYQLTLCTPNQLRSYPYPIDGCIVQGDSKLLRACVGSNIPIVSLITAEPGTFAVGTDEVAGFRDITNYLLELGHRRIAALIGSDESYGKDDTISPLRVQGYLTAFAEKRIAVPENWNRRIHKGDDEFTPANWRHWSYQTMRRWLNDGWSELGCTAIVTQNDSTAIGVIHALRQFGLHVPQDISVTGCDDSGEDSYFDLNITTLHVPLKDIAQKAVDLLIQLIAGDQSKSQKINLSTRIVIGESTSKRKEVSHMEQ